VLILRYTYIILVGIVKAVRWFGKTEVVESNNPPLKRDFVLGKTISGALTHIERYISLGLIPTELGRVLGSLGIIKVIEVGVNLSNSLIGRYFMLLPSHRGVGGLDFDGVLAEYTAIPAHNLIPISKSSATDPYTLLYAEFSYIHNILRYVEDREVLILGCGLSSYILASYIKDLCNVYVACVDGGFRPHIAGLGVYVANYDNIPQKTYDAVIVNTLSNSVILQIPNLVRNNGVIIVPPTLPRRTFILSLNTKVRRIRVLTPTFAGVDHGKNVLSRCEDLVRRYVNVVNSFEDALNSMFHFWRSLYFIKE